MSATKVLTLSKLPSRITSWGQVREEALDQVEPRRAGRREVQVEPRALRQPRPHAVVLVGTVVVNDEMQVHPRRGLPVDLLEKPEPFDMRVLGLGPRDEFAVQVVQGGEQRDRPVAPVVMGPRPGRPAPQGQARLGALQGLTLALLVATEPDRPLGRVQIQTDHVPEFLRELRVVGHLEGLHHMRLDVVGAPDPVDGVRRQPRRGGHGAHAPSRPRRRRLGCPEDNVFDLLGGDRGSSPPTGPIPQARQPLPVKTLRPLVHTSLADAEFCRHLLLRQPGDPSQDDPCPQVVSHGGGGCLRAPLQLGAFGVGDLEDRDRTSHSVHDRREDN